MKNPKKLGEVWPVPESKCRESLGKKILKILTSFTESSHKCKPLIPQL